MTVKRILLFALALCLLLVLSACGESGTAEGDEAEKIVEDLFDNAESTVTDALLQTFGEG